MPRNGEGDAEIAFSPGGAIRQVSTGRPDAEVAQALRLKMMEAAKHVTEVMNEARLSGFFTNLQFKLNQVGEWSLDFVQFQKHF